MRGASITSLWNGNGDRQNMSKYIFVSTRQSKTGLGVRECVSFSNLKRTHQSLGKRTSELVYFSQLRPVSMQPSGHCQRLRPPMASLDLASLKELAAWGTTWHDCTCELQMSVQALGLHQLFDEQVPGGDIVYNTFGFHK